MHYVCCPVCGQRLTERPLGDEGLVPWCEGCGRPWFDSFSTCIIAAVVNPAGQVLLQREVRRPDREVLVAGYMKPGESAEDAARREIREETGLDVTTLRYMGSYPHKDGNMLMLSFAARAEGLAQPASDEVVSSRWASMEDAAASLREGSIAQQVVLAIHDDPKM